MYAGIYACIYVPYMTHICGRICWHMCLHMCLLYDSYISPYISHIWNVSISYMSHIIFYMTTYMQTYALLIYFGIYVFTVYICQHIYYFLYVAYMYVPYGADYERLLEVFASFSWHTVYSSSSFMRCASKTEYLASIFGTLSPSRNRVSSSSDMLNTMDLFGIRNSQCVLSAKFASKCRSICHIYSSQTSMTATADADVSGCSVWICDTCDAQASSYLGSGRMTEVIRLALYTAVLGPWDGDCAGGRLLSTDAGLADRCTKHLSAVDYFLIRIYFYMSIIHSDK